MRDGGRIFRPIPSAVGRAPRLAMPPPRRRSVMNLRRLIGDGRAQRYSPMSVRAFQEHRDTDRLPLKTRIAALETHVSFRRLRT